MDARTDPAQATRIEKINKTSGLAQNVWTVAANCKPNTGLIPQPLIILDYFESKAKAIEAHEAERDALSRPMKELECVPSARSRTFQIAPERNTEEVEDETKNHATRRKINALAGGADS